MNKVLFEQHAYAFIYYLHNDQINGINETENYNNIKNNLKIVFTSNKIESSKIVEPQQMPLHLQQLQILLPRCHLQQNRPVALSDFALN